ncbi:diacylglycerol kinase [Allopusillimonas soli]|nr:diacylglycerol kinase [Allopusillimonas soli]
MRAQFTHSEAMHSSYKSKGGPARLVNALRYSAKGLAAAFRHEAAFRQELLMAAVLVPVAVWISRSLAEAALLIGVVVFVLIVELLNSAIEALADTITVEHHPLIGRAKDLGSAAVLLSLLVLVLTWAAVVVSHLMQRL